ncbi:hypothetical protein M406DRAFT_11941, partial [Cryphonectria parasitica EP155]
STDSLGVRTGLWTNWSRGSVFGWTLTLVQSDANLLIALISFCVTLVGARLWRIVCFTLHFSYSNNSPCDAIYHQRQVLLRNSSDAMNGVADFARLFCAWRLIGKHVWTRSLPLLVLSIFWLASWTVASVFSSQVSSAMGNEVLLLSEHCGFVYVTSVNATTYDEALLFTWLYQYLESSTNYAEQCYGSDDSNLVGCDTFVHRNLPYNITTTAECPFDKNICLDDNSTIVLDSGLVDSREDFGLNTPDGQQFQIRMRVECAPIRTEGYTTNFNLSDDRSYTQYWYGPSGGNFTYEWTNDELWELRKLAIQSANFDVAQTNDDYNIDVFSVYSNNGTLNASEALGSEFDPITELTITNADLSLFFISANQILYLEEVLDPLFRATTQLSEGYSFYFSDQPASPLACSSQQQICVPTGSGSDCTPLLGVYDVFPAAKGLIEDRSASYRNSFDWLLNDFHLNGMTIYQIVKVMSSSALEAKQSLTSGFQPGLPDNQWQIEVERWFQINLAAWQYLFISLATGPGISSIPGSFISTPGNTEEEVLCRNQKITSAAYTSFSMFALLLIFIFGVISIATSYLLPHCIYHYRRRLYESLEWRIHHPLQLQRLAHEELGAGTWSKTAMFVPIAGPDDTLAGLDVSDPSAPKF